MKYTIIALALLAPGAASADYGLDAQKRALECTGRTFMEAASGDFSRWVLPDFIRVRHLRAGQYLDEHCQVR